MSDRVEPLSQEHAQLIREICEKVGRNLLLYRHIEGLLRQIAPNLSASDETVAFLVPDSVEKWQKQIDSGNMLGSLSRQLKAAFSAHRFEGFNDYVNAVRVERNELIHDFPGTAGTSMLTPAQCKACAGYLDERERFAVPLLKFAEELHSGVVDTLASSGYPTPLGRY